MGKTRTAVAVAALAASVVLAPTTAFAKAVTLDDAQGDTYKVQWEEGSEEPTFTESGVDLNADVDKATVSHTDKRIALVTRYASLKKTGMDLSTGVTMKTDDGTEWVLYASAYRTSEGWQASGYSFSAGGPVSRFAARGMSCEGTKAHVDFEKDLLSVSAPRSCFGGPTWIKGHVDAVASKYNEETGVYTQIFDNAHNGNGNFNGWTDRIKKG